MIFSFLRTPARKIFLGFCLVSFICTAFASDPVWNRDTVFRLNNGVKDPDMRVAISADGLTAAIGAYGASPSGINNAGAVYVFTKSGPAWSYQATLTASDKAANDLFGNALALSTDGSNIVIGAYESSPGALSSAGAAYIFTRSGSVWTEQAKLIASDALAGDNFGSAVAMSSDGANVLIGAYKSSPSALMQAGAAYVFTRSGSVWTQQSKLTASDQKKISYFGNSVAMSSDGANVLIGATRASPGSIDQAGAAYVFTRSGSVWTEQVQLVASDKVALDFFGAAVSLSSNADYALIGATHADISGTADAGAVYVFYKTGANWDEQAKLTATNKTVGDFFGISTSVSADGSLVMIGKWNNQPANKSVAGNTYIFTRSGTVWSQQEILNPSLKTDGSWFGRTVSLAADGTSAIVASNKTDYAATIFSVHGACLMDEAVMGACSLQ